MGHLKKHYMQAAIWSILILVILSLNLRGVLADATGSVVEEAGQQEKLLLNCSFEGTYACSNGEMPSQNKDLLFVEGKVGKGILVGKSGFLEYIVPNNFDSNEGTIEMWVKPNWNSEVMGAHRFFYTRYDSWEFYLGTEQFNYHIYFNTLLGNIKYKIVDWKEGKWHHLTATWDRVATKLYIDGIYIGESNYNKPPSEPSHIYIGSENTQRNQADAVIDEVKIFNYVRNSSQITEDYNAYPKDEPINQTLPKEKEEEIPEKKAPEEEPEVEYLGKELLPEKEPVKTPHFNQVTLLLAFIVFLLAVIIYLLIELRWGKR